MNKKFIAFSILFFLFQSGFGQDNILLNKISINFQNMKVKDALEKLKTEKNISLAFNNKLHGMNKTISKEFHNESVEFILKTIFADTQLSFKIIGKQIVIFIKESSHSSIMSVKPTGKITGKIVDSLSLIPIPYALLHWENTNFGNISDLDGMFEFNGIPKGIYTLIISAGGYKELRIDSVKIENGEDINLGLIYLTESDISIQEVVISPGSFSVMGDKPLSVQILAEKDIKNMSFSEDITRAVSRLPGVASNDYSSKFTVRGGETDEVLITLDGMELIDPFHQRDFSGGLFSIVDIEAISGVELHTGGFSAEYGNRQSAVFNMISKTAKENTSRSLISLSVVNAGLYTQGRFANNKGSYLFSARRGLLDQTIRIVGNNQEIPIYYDMIGKAEYSFNKKHTLSFHALYSGDKTMVRDIILDTLTSSPLIDPDTVSNVRALEYDSLTDWDIHDTRYTNMYGWLTLKSRYTRVLFSRTMAYGGMLDYDRNGNVYKEGFSDKNKFKLHDIRNMSFFGLKQDWNWEAHKSILLKTGFDVKQLNADYDYSLNLQDIRVNSEGEVNDYFESKSIQTKQSGLHASGYLSSKIMLWSKLFLEPSVRYDHISYTNDNQWSPRVSAAFALSKKSFFRAAWGHYHQSQLINQMEVNYEATEFRESEMAKHYVAGIEHLFSNGLNIRLEAYYKDITLPSIIYQNLRDQWEVFPETRNDMAKLYISGARSKGIELFMKYDVGKKISWWFSYALAKAEEHVDSIDFNGLLDKQTGWLPRYNNQNHTVYVDFIYRPAKTWLLNVSWQYWNGWPITLYEYEYIWRDDGTIHYYPHHTLYRGNEYKPYHRLDLRINKRFNLKKGHLNTYVHIINVYNRKNVKKYDRDVRNDNDQLVPDGMGGYQTFESYAEWFGIVPAIGISWELNNYLPM
jgi:outer membrane receptor protein involved in Fe transport